MSNWKKPPNNINRKYPEGDWRRMCSQAAGYYIKMREQTVTVIRGGVAIELVKTGQVHVPCIPLGHLDEYGVGVLDTMLEGNYSIMEIVEFFANYEPTPGMVFNKRKFIEDNPPPPTPPDTEEEETEEEEEECEEEQDAEEEEEEEEEQEDEEEKEEVEIEKEIKEEEEKEEGKEAKEKENEEKDPINEGDYNDASEEPKIEEPKPTKKKKKKRKMEKKMKEKKEKKKKPAEETKGYVFSLNDPDFMKIPFMHPDKKKTNPTFEVWFKILYSVCDPKGLTDEQCIEVMGIRMGGSYLQELKQLKREGRDLEYIELWFLRKDLEGRAFQVKLLVAQRQSDNICP